MSAMGLESDILKSPHLPSEKKRNKLDLHEEFKKRDLEKSRLNIVVIGRFYSPMNK